jgi:hypothetical protein
VEEAAQARLHLLGHLDARGGGAYCARLAVRRQVGAARGAVLEMALEVDARVVRQDAVEVVVEDLDELTPTMWATSSLESSSTSFSTSTAR